MEAAISSQSGRAFRPEVEGLRGIAILMVVLFHARLLGLPGGFVGVDVFFVVSGFLITDQLVGERERTGGNHWRAFMSRRLRRLMPVAVAVLAATLAASWLVVAPLDLPGAALDAIAAALGVANIRFAFAAGDYFASQAAPSAFLHFWALAVEVQFYVVWPIVLLLAARSRQLRLTGGIVLAGVLVASMAANLVVTEAAVSWAFYSLPTRLWEFAVGGLVALAAGRISRLPVFLPAAVGWVGLAGLVGAGIGLSGEVAYPGIWALVPALGAAAVIAAGPAAPGPGLLLGSAIPRFLGRICYSLYLWHWPILVLPAVALESELGEVARAALAGSAIVVGWASWRFLEQPYHGGRPAATEDARRTMRPVGLAFALVVAVAGGVAIAGSASDGGSAIVEPSPAATSPVAASATPEGTASSAPTASATSGSSAGPTPSTLPSAQPSSPSPPTPSPTPGVVIRLPSDVQPPLARAREDEERLRGDGCLAFEAARVPPRCVYGNKAGTFTVALVGDSHAAQWFPAIAAVAAEHDWRILTYVKVACPFVDMRVRNILLKREYYECAAFNDAVIARLNAERPDLTLISMSRFAIHPVLSSGTSLEAQAAAFARMIRQIPGRVALIVDTPEAGRDIPACLSRHVSDVRACAIARSVAYSGSLGALERAAMASSDAFLIDLTDRICRTWPCPVVADRMIVFRDSRHLTATFSASLGPDLDAVISVLLTL